MGKKKIQRLRTKVLESCPGGPRRILVDSNAEIRSEEAYLSEEYFWPPCFPVFLSLVYAVLFVEILPNLLLPTPRFPVSPVEIPL